MSLALGQRRTNTGYPFWIADRGHAHWLAVTHGSFGAHDDFGALLEPLAQRYNLLFWDLPAHGGARNFKPARRLDDAARRLREAMDAAKVERAHHLGFSFGGMVVQRFARLHPERTSALIAYACVPITLIRAAAAAWLVHALTSLHFMQTPWPRFCAAFCHQVSIDPEQQRLFHDAMIVQSPRVRNAIYEAMIYSASYEPRLSYNMPVAFIYGARDDRFPGAQAAMLEWASRLPPSLVRRIENAGHLVHAEQPAAFYAALEDVLAEIERNQTRPLELRLT